MLKIYEVKNYVSIDGRGWFRVVDSWFGCDYVLSDKLMLPIFIKPMSFAETREYLESHELMGLENGQTYWRKRPTVVVKSFRDFEAYSYKHFSTLEYKTEFEEVKDPSLSWLERNLSSEDALRYLNDKWTELQEQMKGVKTNET
jgi:hypothetical protein